VGTIINGALVEVEIPATIVSDNHLELLLRNPDFTSAARMAAALNLKFPASSVAVDATTVRVGLPTAWPGSAVDFISQIESLEISPDAPARVIINERTGTIVATARIHISNCAISHGNVTISIASTPIVSQPGSFSSGGSTTVTSQTDAKIKEDKGSMVALPELPTVEKVAAALNTLGVTPRDMMSMFEAMKQAGALQADLLMR
jgi:flagellar P-ring protein precursor FlgI